MPVLRLETRISASLESCFDLARDVDAHMRTTARSRERAVAGVTTGLMGAGDTVTWEAVHLGIRQRLTVRITRYERPRLFVDEMVEGAFRRLTHTHEFRAIDEGTLMVDTFDYSSPLGVLGRLADVLFLKRYLLRFLSERARALKDEAERVASRS
jgi:ligand-binding SRPBCC domain-containing protein